jgi:hypothetical protein
MGLNREGSYTWGTPASAFFFLADCSSGLVAFEQLGSGVEVKATFRGGSKF